MFHESVHLSENRHLEILLHGGRHLGMGLHCWGDASWSLLATFEVVVSLWGHEMSCCNFVIFWCNCLPRQKPVLKGSSSIDMMHNIVGV